MNAANFTPDIGPGSLIALFGAGFVAPGLEVAAEINGSPAAVVQASPFRLNVVVPPDAAPGAQYLRIASPLGAAEVPLNLLPAAPAVFESSAGAPLIRNEDGSLNTPETPARRGRPIRIYSTGLGLISGDQAAPPLRVLFGEVPLAPQSVSLVSELSGVYEIRLTVPPATPPASQLALALQQSDRTSKPVFLAIE